MKLCYRVLWRLSACLLLLALAGGAAFYAVIIDEIHDETDDYLEEHARRVITLKRAGHDVSPPGTWDSSYSTREVTEVYARGRPRVEFLDEMVYVDAKLEAEPTRVLKTIFTDAGGRYHEIIIRTPTIDKDELQGSVFYSMLLLCCSFLVASLLVIFMVFSRETRPLYTLLRWLRSYTIGQRRVLASPRAMASEFKELYRAVELSTRKNEEIFEQQKQFISNAAHELQTPLAICKNQLELLAEREDGERGLAGIMKVQETLARLIRLNRSLLFLSRIENGQFVERQEVSFNDLVRRVSPDFGEAYAYKRVSFRVEERGEFRVVMDEVLATSLVTNLLKNAYLHCREGGSARVEICRDFFLVANSGDEALDERVFERFYRPASEHSTGLGLAIARSICRGGGLELYYAFEAREHRFRVARSEVHLDL
ncbi:MAG: HAMP domain-containing histidine kinase [Odoribacteraceae bacterium]|jgi:signal transduction histidine kinase|nr:HAMP domain-containing histidine kinase [Odoribacteraceae bacterium]